MKCKPIPSLLLPILPPRALNPLLNLIGSLGGDDNSLPLDDAIKDALILWLTKLRDNEARPMGATSCVMNDIVLAPRRLTNSPSTSVTRHKQAAFQ